MTVTLRITDCYTDTLPLLEKVDCLCCFTYNDDGDEIRKDPEPGCPYCDGHGFEVEKVWPFELNLANRNARTLLSALGLEPGEGPDGEVSADELLAAINSVDPALILRDETVEKVSGGPTIIDCGITLEQAARYTSALRGIAAEAIERGKTVCWS